MRVTETSRRSPRPAESPATVSAPRHNDAGRAARAAGRSPLAARLDAAARPHVATSATAQDARLAAQANDSLRRAQLFARVDARGAGAPPAATTAGGVAGPTTPRTPEQALAEVNAHFVASTGSAGTIGGTVTDYVDVATPPDAETTRLLTANQPLADEARARLSPADQARYDNLQTSLATDPRAQLALQTMLIDGRLPGEPALRGTTVDGACTQPLDLLGQLDILSRTPTASGLAGGADLLATTVKEVAFPQSINQGYKGTCTVTATATALAYENPAEYARIVMGLASPAGTVTMANGDTLTRESNTLADDGAGRAVTQRLLGPALMEYGNGLLDYDSERDRSALIVPGLTNDGVARVAGALFGREFDNYTTLTTGLGLGYSNANNLIEAFEAGKSPILFSANFPNSGHELLLRNVEVVDGTTYFTFQNPWGQEERVTYEELSARITGVVQPR